MAITEPTKASTSGSESTTGPMWMRIDRRGVSVLRTSALKKTKAKFCSKREIPSVSMIWFMAGSLRTGRMVDWKIPAPIRKSAGTVMNTVRYGWTPDWTKK